MRGKQKIKKERNIKNKEVTNRKKGRRDGTEGRKEGRKEGKIERR
jgi:hypothetical protein